MITLPKAMTFDCYGTLIDWESGIQHFFAQRLAAHQLAVLLSAGNPMQTGAAPDWRPVGPLA